MKKHKHALTALTLTTAALFSAVAPIALPQASAASAFADIAASDAAYRTAIEALAGQQVISGYEDSQFKASRPVSRAELAKMVALALHVQADPAKTPPAFEDVGAGDWFRPYVAALTASGVMTGEAGRFQPQQSVTREQLVAVIASALKADTAKIQALLGSAAGNGMPASRGEAALLTYAAQQLAPARVTSIQPLNAITLQITFSAPLPKEEIDVAAAKQNFAFDNGLTTLNIPQLKSGAVSTYIVPVSPQKPGTTYTLAYKGQPSVTFAASAEKLALRSAQQVAADTFEIESSLEDGVADYGYVVASYRASRKGAFTVDDNNTAGGKKYQILSSMRDKQVTITPEGGEPMTASYLPFTQATDGRQAPKFRLPNGQTFRPGGTYTVTSDWAVFNNPSFTAKDIAPLMIQSAQAVSPSAVDITLAQDPQDELFVLRSVNLTAPDGTALTAQYKLTSRKGATGTFELANGGKLTPGVVYKVTPAGTWASAGDVTVTAK